MQRILELDGLRAIAILLVISCHYGAFVALTNQLSEFGWLGVDIFFVLSGYLITTILLGLRGEPRPYRTFYARRVVRIFPPYFAVTFLVLIFAALAGNRAVFASHSLLSQALFLQAWGGMKELVDVVRHPIWRLTHLDSLLKYAGQLPVGYGGGIALRLQNVFPTYWSLSIEEYFYLLWAPVVLRFPRRWIVGVGVLVSVLDVFIRWSAGTRNIYFNLFSHFDALLYGALLGLLLERWKQRTVPIWAEKALMVVFAVCISSDLLILYKIRPVIGRDIRSSPLVMVLGLPLFWMGTACVIGLLVLRANSGWWFARLLRTKPLQYLGTISYTVYLVHVLAATLVFGFFHLFAWGQRLSLVQACLSVVLTILLARLSWHYIEKPALRWKDQRFASPHPEEPALD